MPCSSRRSGPFLPSFLCYQDTRQNHVSGIDTGGLNSRLAGYRSNDMGRFRVPIPGVQDDWLEWMSPDRNVDWARKGESFL